MYTRSVLAEPHTTAAPPLRLPLAAVVTPSAPLKGGEVRLPDFQGFPIREAIRSAKALGLSPQVEGTGRVSRQEPPAGTVLPKGAVVKFVFEPPA